eukprot:GILJ01001530.1.p1 GENE.GILJ01001530.1~~GILJ01001530.1.p1  ORF type:complete len:106 (+),score=10.87 GILJ01001530.1:55-372(+)
MGSEVEETLRNLLQHGGVTGYVVVNADGIPVKFHDVPYERAVQYAALVSDMTFKTKKYVKELLPAPDNDLTCYRMRTKLGNEIIVSTAADYTLVVLQNCHKRDKK